MTLKTGSFFNLYAQGFLRVATATPFLRVADVAFNLERTLAAARAAHEEAAGLVLFPELGLTAYAIDDLLQQDAILDAAEEALLSLAEASASLMPVIVVGLPLRAGDALYNVAAIIHRGRILGLVPKSYLPNYREFYERRHFAPGSAARVSEVMLKGERIPFGTDLLFEAEDLPPFVLHAEICEDVWVQMPPSAYAAGEGATVLANLSASNVTIGKSDYRHTLCRAHSGRCLAAYLYSAAGPGESTTDLAWDGHAMIYENGVLLAETERFLDREQLIFADIDLERLALDRLRQGSFADCAAASREGRKPFRRIAFALAPPREEDLGLKRKVSRFPFVPDDETRLNELCFEAYNIQLHGLKKRLEATGAKTAIIGVSGGLDSTQSLIVTAQTFDRLGLPRANILAYTLPAFATSSQTKSNAWRLMRALGVSSHEIDMTAQCRQMLDDIGHPFAGGKPVYDVTFENVQAGARTSTLFRLANQHQGLVIGTGDLSELALGWCTYGVGDHMSHYNVNASVPKTLIQHLVRWVVREGHFGADVGAVLTDILGTEISPELVPGDGEKPAQLTESVVGPYELQDFNLFYTTRYGFAPSKIAFLAWHGWRDKAAGGWPAGLVTHNAYSLAEIKSWLLVFLTRFFAQSQFKRSALPNGPKVSSGGSLSPRGDWRAPSDSVATVWLEEAKSIPDL
jgi:NAD+ synthase (glutamine-hydrolysing)